MGVKVFIIQVFLCLAAARDWTCEECEEGGKILGAITSSDSDIANQIDLFLSKICPQADDVDFCVKNLPTFWSQICPIVMPIHFSYICSDIEECNPPPPPKIKSKITGNDHYPSLKLQNS